jgi:hypothetical protein
MAEQTFGRIFFLKVSIYPKSDTKDRPAPPKKKKKKIFNLKNPNFNIKYLPNDREYFHSTKISESGVENWICLNYNRFLGHIAELEKYGGSMDLVRLSGGLIVKKRRSD